jgi:hypothetical protein
MSGSTRRLLAGVAVVVTATACSDLSSTSGNTLVVSEAFQTVPAGFSANSNTFDASGDDGLPFLPGTIDRATGFHDNSGSGGDNKGRGRGPEDHHDGFGRGIRGSLMGGGIGPDFIGGIGFGRGKGRGPFGVFSLPSSCTFSADTGRVTCPAASKHDLTVNVSFAFTDVAGAAQAAFDTGTTNSVNVRTDVSGTKTRREGSTSTVSHTSDRTVTGLATGSTQRTVNGTSKAHEVTTGTRDDVGFTAVRDAGDTTTNVVIPLVDGRPTIPTSGTVVRSMTVTITPEGGTVTTRSRREEVTFDGTNVVSVKITQDGETKNCTITLPSKRLVCE